MNKIIKLLTIFTLLVSCKNEEKPIEKAKIKKPILVEQPIEIISDSEIECNFLKNLLKQEIGNQSYKELQVTELPYFVEFDNDGDSYTVYFSVVEKQDFNQDGIIDYIVNRTSEGMLGGNSNTNKSYIYYIMKDAINENEKHEILGYAPFSYNIIDKAEFKNNKFYASITQNYRTYIDVNNLQSTDLSFIYKNGNVYEESYLSKCKLAQLKSKTIFLNMPEVAKRTRSIDMHNYTETIDEIYKNKDTIIRASLSGCDNLDLSFETDYKLSSAQTNDDVYKKRFALKLLRSLSKTTQFSKDVSIVYDYYRDNEITNEFNESINGYQFRVLIDTLEDKTRGRFLINISKINNPEQGENWEITTRKK